MKATAPSDSSLSKKLITATTVPSPGEVPLPSSSGIINFQGGPYEVSSHNWSLCTPLNTFTGCFVHLLMKADMGKVSFVITHLVEARLRCFL